jgi:sec-independent protein translocase protein TatA
MLNISPQELLLILAIALIVVGPQRLPSLGRSIGKGLREIRRAQEDVKQTIRVNLEDDPPNGGRSASATTTEQTTVDPSEAADRAPAASEPLPPSEVREISRSLGRGLAELRRAREEVQRSFRVDLNEPAARRTPAADRRDPATGSPGEEPAGG